MLEAVWLRRFRAPARPFLLTAVMAALTVGTVGAVALVAMGRLGITDAIVLAMMPWVLLAAALRPDWLVLTLIALPASFTATLETKRLLLIITVALAALLVTRRRFSLAWGTGLSALLVINAAGYFFHADVGPFAAAVNQGTMLILTYYILLALLTFNLAVLGELDGDRVGSALVIGVFSTLAVGLAGYGGGWFETGPGIITQTYLGIMAAAAFGVSLAWLFLAGESGARRVGHFWITGFLLFLSIASLSRGPWISAAVTFAFLAFRFGRRGYVFVLIAVIVLALLAPAARQKISRSESGDILAEIATGDITTGRWRLWTELWERAQPALPWGHGFGYAWSLSSEDLFGQSGEFQSDESGVVPPHNDFIYLLVEFGIPGVLLLSIFWIQLFRARSLAASSEVRIVRRGAWVLLGALVAGLTFGMVDEVFAVRPLAERFFPVAGLIFGLAELERARWKELLGNAQMPRANVLPRVTEPEF